MGQFNLYCRMFYESLSVDVATMNDCFWAEIFRINNPKNLTGLILQGSMQSKLKLKRTLLT